MTNKRIPLELVRSARVGKPDAHAIQLEFNRELTKEEYQFFHETCERTAFLMQGLSK